MKSEDQATPTPEGIASLVENKLITPQDADVMRARVALQAKLPAGYVLVGYSEPWFMVGKQWDGKQVAPSDVARETIADKLTGFEVRGPKFEDGFLVWAVQGATPEADAEKPAPRAEERTAVEAPAVAAERPSPPRPTSGRSG